MSQKSRPVYVLVGGVSHTPKFWEATIRELHAIGFQSTAVAYPTCGKNNLHVKQSEDVTAIKNAVEEVLESGKNVVLVLHSYAGWPGSRAVKGLDIDTRRLHGKTNGIVEVIFLAAFIIPDNAEVKNYLAIPPWLTNNDGLRKPNEMAIPLLFNDLDPEKQRYWFSQLQWQNHKYVDDVIPDAPWKLNIHKTYILITEDKTASLEFQLQMLLPVIDGTWSITSIRSGHEPFLSQPKVLAEVLTQPRVGQGKAYGAPSGEVEESSHVQATPRQKSQKSMYEAKDHSHLYQRGTMEGFDTPIYERI